MEMEERGQKKLKLLLSTTLSSLPPGQSTATITGQVLHVVCGGDVGIWGLLSHVC